VTDERDWPDSTVHLGQFDRVTANRIAGALERAGIWWWFKEPGFLSQVWEFGVRLFVDRERLDEAKDIVERVRADPKRYPVARPDDAGGEPGEGAPEDGEPDDPGPRETR
jgi:hypothetical protein